MSDVVQTRLVLIRHGESQVTVDRVIGGHRTCRGLSPLGLSQSERLRERLVETGELDGATLISSNFQRAIETAEAIAPAIVAAGDHFVVDSEFGEHDPGPELDGMSFADYVERYGSPDRDADPDHDVFPGGETLAEFHVRIGAAIARILTAHAGSTVVIACHGGVVDAVFRHALHAPSSGEFDLWTTNTSLTEFAVTQDSGEAGESGESGEPMRRWRLVRYNDASHLHGLPRATPRS